MKTYNQFVEQLAESLILEDEIAKALKDKNSVDNRYHAALKAKTTHHLDIMQKDRSSDVRAEVGRHPKATSSHIDKALEDKHPHVRHSAFDHNNPTIKSHHVEKGINDSDHMVRAAAIQHDAATHEHIKKALGDSHPMVRKFAAAAAKKKGLKVE